VGDHGAVTITKPARRALRQAIKDRVAGGDLASQRAKEARIWGADAPRWFGPDDPIWRVHSDAAMFAGGIAALIVQALHPLAMAGVAGHSGFKGDPWGRLQRTSDFIAYTTFAPITSAQTVIRTVRLVHERVVGVAPDGRSYAASDPALLEWVHTAETWAFLRAHQVYGPRAALSDRDADTYVAQLGSIDARLGFGDPPRTVSDLESRLTAYRSDLEVTEAARDTIDFLLRDPPMAGPLKVAYGVLAQGAVALVPPWVRDAFGLRVRPGAEARARAATATMRWAIEHPAHEVGQQARFRASAVGGWAP
jgi:uncharacterized protein (DUF2236 family)